MGSTENMVQDLSGNIVRKVAEPGSVWTDEADQLKWIYIAQEGNHAVRITIRKSTGCVIGIDLEGWIGKDCQELERGAAR